MKIGFIGAGNMGYAMLKGALTVFEDTIVYTDVNKIRLDEVKTKIGIDYVLTNQEVVDQSDIIVLAIKPQYMSEALINLRIDRPKILVSIAPGVTIEYVNALIGGAPKIVRAMPNTPALVGEGMSGICFGDMDFTKEDKDEVLKLFNSLINIYSRFPTKLLFLIPTHKTFSLYYHYSSNYITVLSWNTARINSDSSYTCTRSSAV